EELYKREFYEGTLNQFNGAWSGLPVKEAKDKMVAFLQEKGMGGILYEPSRPAETRAGKQVQVAILPDQWFIDYSGKQWKETTKRHVEQMTIFPPRFRRNIMDAIDWLDHRPCIRKRGLGTPFPFDNPKEEWMIEPLSDSTIYMLFYLAIPLIRESGLNIDDLDDVFWDAALLGKELNSSDKRCKTAQTIHEQITFWYPNDQRHTAPAHISNHISFFLLTHTLLFDESYWPKACTFNEMLVRNGVKMSKSKGNVIPLQQAIRDHGADLVRLYMASSAGFERVVDWKDTQVPQVKKKLQEIEGVLEAAASQKEETLSPAQEWLAETLKQRLGEAYAAYDDMEMMLAAQKIFFETLNDIKRFKKVFGEKETPAVKRVLKEWLVLLTPITPFLGEELWAKSGWKGFASLQALQKPIGNPSPHMDDHMNFIEKVLGDIERVKKLVKGKQVTTLYLYSPDATETRWLNEAQEAL
ncbi:MAG: class I tRNA ligase family protein, partial [archaeon]|nr:class I tRNA ligase family protein [archaeon]